jgi:hypothetical protein
MDVKSIYRLRFDDQEFRRKMWKVLCSEVFQRFHPIFGKQSLIVGTKSGPQSLGTASGSDGGDKNHRQDSGTPEGLHDGNAKEA